MHGAKGGTRMELGSAGEKGNVLAKPGQSVNLTQVQAGLLSSDLYSKSPAHTIDLLALGKGGVGNIVDPISQVEKLRHREK